MKKIWRYVGSSTSSANQLARNRQQNLTRSTANRSRVATTAVTGGNVIGGNKALTAAAETMIAIKKAYGDAPTQGTWIENVKLCTSSKFQISWWKIQIILRTLIKFELILRKSNLV